MTTGSALDSTGLRLVRKGVNVSKRVQARGGWSVLRGVVTKANGDRCFVQWGRARGSTYEWCNKIEVTDGLPQ